MLLKRGCPKGGWVGREDKKCFPKKAKRKKVMHVRLIFINTISCQQLQQLNLIIIFIGC